MCSLEGLFAVVPSPDPARGPGRSVRPAASGASERPAGSAVSPSCPSSAGRFLTGKGSCYTVNDILVKKKKKIDEAPSALLPVWLPPAGWASWSHHFASHHFSWRWRHNPWPGARRLYISSENQPCRGSRFTVHVRSRLGGGPGLSSTCRRAVSRGLPAPRLSRALSTLCR